MSCAAYNSSREEEDGDAGQTQNKSKGVPAYIPIKKVVNNSYLCGDEISLAPEKLPG